MECVSLIQKMFPNAKIIIDTFHLVQLISRSLNKTRIRAMKSNKAAYNKMKRYWKLILKDRNELTLKQVNIIIGSIVFWILYVFVILLQI